MPIKPTSSTDSSSTSGDDRSGSSVPDNSVPGSSGSTSASASASASPSASVGSDVCPLSHPAPLLLYGYGAYGISWDPEFSAAALSLCDRGVVYAIAHIRGKLRQA